MSINFQNYSIKSFFLILFLLSLLIYNPISFFSNAPLIPTIVLVIFFLIYQSFNTNLLKINLTLSILITLYLGFTLIMHDIDLFSLINSYLYLIISITTGILFINLLMLFDDAELIKIFKGIIIFILICAFLEIYFPAIKELFQTIAISLHGNIYTSIDRDISWYGFVRPIFITSEPSHLAIFLTFISTCLILIDSSLKSLKNFFILYFLMLFLIRSPLLISIFIVLFIVSVGKFNISKTHIFYLLFTTIALIFLNYSRIEDFLLLSDRSSFIRLILPYLIYYNQSLLNIFFGTSFGNESLINSIYFQLDYFSLPQVNWDNIENRLVNSFAELLIRFGLLGSFFIYFFLYKSFIPKISIKKIIILFIIIFCLCSLFGGVNGIRFWVVLLTMFYLYGLDYGKTYCKK